MWVAGYGPKALAVAGRVGDGVIIQLADPEIIQWIMGTARAAAEEAGRDPAALKCIVCAPSMITDDIAVARDETRWFPAMVSNHVKDLIDRYGTDGSVVPKALTDYVEARKFYDYNEHSRVGAAHGAFVTDEICDRFSVLGTRRAGDGEAAGARGDRRRPVLDLPDDAQPGGDARGLRRAHHPGVQGRGGIGDLARRSRSRPGAASPPAGSGSGSCSGACHGGALGADGRAARARGPGSGSSSSRPGPARPASGLLPLIQPGRRAALDRCRARDGRGRPPPGRRRSGWKASSSRSRTPPPCRSPTRPSTAILCRFGLMLVPDMERAAAEIARVLRPGGRVVLAVWASSRRQPLDHRGRAGRHSSSASPTLPTTMRPARSGSATRSGCARWSRAVASRSRSSRRCRSDWAARVDSMSGGRRPATPRACSRRCSSALTSGRGGRRCAREPRRYLQEYRGGRRLAQRARRSPGWSSLTPRLTPEGGAALRIATRGSSGRARSRRARPRCSAVVFSRSRIGFDSTTSNEPTIPDSAISSQARWASR